MYSLIISFGVLIVGYMIFSRFVNKAFAPDSRKTPAIAINDKVDCVPMSKSKLFLVQLLNIAGTGPIFGPIMGAVFGPVVFLWIIFGTILGGAVHDFMVGMVSSRHKGASIAELSGIYTGRWLKYLMRGFSVLLLILCGTVFLVTPANILADLTPSTLNFWFWVSMIVVYYFLATILPIDKIIGKLYPVFGALLLLMAFSVLGAIFVQGYATRIPEFWQTLNWEHPKGLAMWPCMFVTVACGAISGFHATQSPMVSKCIQNEQQGRQVFYGAMVCEAVIALIWAAAGVAFYGTAQALQAAIDAGTAGGVVAEISKNLLGPFGGILAILGVVVCPITSGDTAFRSARLIVAEATHLDQKKVWNRLILTLPVVGAGIGLAFLDFDVLWRYFAAANQTLAMIALWIATFYFLKKGKYKNCDLITMVPAVFMVAVCVTYICVGQECINAPIYVGYPIGAAFSIASLLAYLIYRFIYLKKHQIKRPFMIKHLHKKKIFHTKMLNEFKQQLIKKNFTIMEKKDLDVLALKSLDFYLEDYRFLQQLRVGSRVEEILQIQEKIKRCRFSTKSRKERFFNFFRLINYSLMLKSKRFTSKFVHIKPMNVAVYYNYFKYILNYAMKKGVIYRSDEDKNCCIIVLPNNFQRINYSHFQPIFSHIFAFITGHMFEVNRAIQFDDSCRHHLVDKVNDEYWYIYSFVFSEKEKVNQKMLGILDNFTNKHKIKLYYDAINQEIPVAKKLGFKTVTSEEVDYAKLPYKLFIK